MSDPLVSLLVPALAIAVNPVPISAAVTLLMSARGRRDTATFLATLVVAMAADGLITLFLIGQSSASTSSRIHGAIQVAFGLVFLALFMLQWRGEPVPPGEEPGWMKLMNKAGFGAAVVLGLALTNYALLSAGVSTIREAELSTSSAVTALAFFIAVSVVTVAATLILFLARPRWAQVRLARLRIWLMKHSRVILMAVFGLMGALFVAQGLAVVLY
ncbi:MAG: GAP family protein [Actinomycetes bacterium]